MRLLQNYYPTPRLEYFGINIVECPDGVFERCAFRIDAGNCAQLAIGVGDGRIDIRVHLSHGGLPIRQGQNRVEARCLILKIAELKFRGR